MRLRISILTLTMLAMLTFAMNSRVDAVTLVEETFSYDPGALAGLNGGTNWSGGWITTSPPPTILNGSLVYPSIQFDGPPTGNRMGVTDNDQGTINSYRQYNTVQGDSAGAGSSPLGGITLWVSLLVHPIENSTAALSGDGMMFDVRNPGNSSGFTAGFRSDALVWILGSPAFANEIPTTIPVVWDTTVNLVFRLDFDGGAGNDRISMYVNPGPTLPGSPDAVRETANIGDLGWMYLGNFNVAGDWDEIVISNEAPFQDNPAVPEPSTLALGLLGLVGVGACVWRRKLSRCA
jgi:hypothetical protein